MSDDADHGDGADGGDEPEVDGRDEPGTDGSDEPGADGGDDSTLADETLRVLVWGAGALVALALAATLLPAIVAVIVPGGVLLGVYFLWRIMVAVERIADAVESEGIEVRSDAAASDAANDS